MSLLNNKIVHNYFFLTNFITMQMKRKFRSHFDKQSPSFIIAGLVVGAVLAVGGSVLATTVGNSISVTGTLSVGGASTLTGNTGIGTTTAGTLLSVQGIGNWAGGGSTVYSTYTFPSFTATSTSANNGIGTTTPGSAFSIQGVGNFVSAATSTLYTPLMVSNFTATSTVLLATNTGLVGIGTTSPGTILSVQGLGNWSGGGSTVYSTYTLPSFIATSTTANNGIGTSTPGTRLSIQGVANYVDASTGTSTIYSRLQLPSFLATSTIATSTFSNGLLISTTNGSVGIATTTPANTFSLGGDALIGAGSNGTSTLALSSSGSGFGSCIQMRAASSSDLYRIYIGKNTGIGSTTGLMIEQGSCR